MDRAPIQTVGENFSRRFVPASRSSLSAVTLLVTGDVRRAMTMLLDRLPLRGRPVHPDRDQRGDRQRRAPRHPDQGRLAPGAGRPGRRDRLRQDRHADRRPAGRHEYRCLHKDWQPEQVLAYAASSEIHSRHPLAEAVIRSTEERHITIPPHEECEVLVGLGMRTQADGRTLLLGSPSLLRSEKRRGCPKKASRLGRQGCARQARDPAAAGGGRQAGRADQPARRGAPRGSPTC